MEDGGTGGRRAQEDVKKEEALVRGSEEEPTKKTPPPSHFKPAGTIEFRIGADTKTRDSWTSPAHPARTPRPHARRVDRTVTKHWPGLYTETRNPRKGGRSALQGKPPHGADQSIEHPKETNGCRGIIPENRCPVAKVRLGARGQIIWQCDGGRSQKKARIPLGMRALSKETAATYSRTSYTCTTIGNAAFDGRVRDGIGSCHFAEATRPAKSG